MKIYKFLIIIALTIFSRQLLFCQENDINYSKFTNLLKREPHIHKVTYKKGLLSFYKKYISTQDFGSCPYSPSCSIYTFQAIKKDGLLFGIIKGLDRLSRCNLNQKDHYLHTKNNKLIDIP